MKDTPERTVLTAVTYGSHYLLLLENKQRGSERETDNKDNGSSGLEVLPRLSWPMLCIKTTSTKENLGHCHSRLSSERNRRSNMPTGPTSSGSLLPP